MTVFNPTTYQQAIFARAEDTDPARPRNIVVSAYAGCGKTSTSVEYVNRLLGSVAMFAFGAKNAKDLRARVTSPNADVTTFNAFGARIVRMYMTPRGEPDRFRESKLAAKLLGIAAPKDMVQLIGKLAAKGKGTLPGLLTRERLAVEGKAAKAAGDTALADSLRARWQSAPLAEMIALAAEHDLVPDPMWQGAGWSMERVAKAALDVLELSKTAHTRKPQDPLYDNTISFDDQVYLPLVNNWLFPMFDHVLVDECQDTNPAGLMTARRVLKPDGTFTVVGDRNQALFAFRGADTQSMDKIKAEMSQPGKGGVVELPLPQTFRCAKSIVRDAQRFVPDFVAHPSNPEGEVRRVAYRNVVVDAGPGDFVLSRTNAPLARVCLRLLMAGKRAKVEGRKVGENLIKLADTIGAKSRSIPEFLEALVAWEERESKRATAASKDPDKLQAKLDRIEDDAECLRAMCDGVKGLPALRARIDDLFADDAAAVPQVVCMTVHKAKGLETDRVFVLEDTLAIRISKKMAKTDTVEKAERRAETERCIRFVAATRAKTNTVYVVGLEDGAGASMPAPSPAAQVTGDTLQQVAAAIAATRQLMEKDESDELKSALASLEEKHSKLTKARA
jgi:superfamily I DNA/RNA helicase